MRATFSTRCPRRSRRERLPLRADALVALHRPVPTERGGKGRRRLAFDELLLLQLGIARRARERERPWRRRSASRES